DYLGKPFRPDEVLLVLRKAEERDRLRRENLILRREMSRRAPQLVAERPAMKEVLRVVHKVAPAPSTVLIAGESGTGEELIARARVDQPGSRLAGAGRPLPRGSLLSAQRRRGAAASAARAAGGDRAARRTSHRAACGADRRGVAPALAARARALAAVSLAGERP